ncbi:UNVERIFIED_CONTAM: hypothetical protein PYX00_005067 [Menopon gallinae]|uniref:Uncharacterized protein n=1 Tax=Menopon gallinae TaxID=328185 RepID=A0AAW2HPS7_9NEOP
MSQRRHSHPRTRLRRKRETRRPSLPVRPGRRAPLLGEMVPGNQRVLQVLAQRNSAHKISDLPGHQISHRPGLLERDDGAPEERRLRSRGKRELRSDDGRPDVQGEERLRRLAGGVATANASRAAGRQGQADRGRSALGKLHLGAFQASVYA